MYTRLTLLLLAFIASLPACALPVMLDEIAAILAEGDVLRGNPVFAVLPSQHARLDPGSITQDDDIPLTVVGDGHSVGTGHGPQKCVTYRDFIVAKCPTVSYFQRIL